MTPRARALAALGEVYLEHDMTPDALASFKEAVQLEPQNLGYKKQLASALERARSYRESRVIWQELAEKAKTSGDKILAREARSRIVTLVGLRARPRGADPDAHAEVRRESPPDVESGRMLAEVQLHLRKLADAEATLRRVITVAPGDADSYLALERVLVQENKTGDAIAVLEKLVAVEPKRARELYQRMAQYALQLYRDDDAIKYAARAVELNPDDAEGHRRLGEMYRQRQDVEHAIVEFRAAIAKNDRLYITYLELADLLLSKGQGDEADRLFRRVIRGAPDEELVSRAARLSMQINLGKGTLESLEQELLPLAIGNPQRKVYRRLLVEIYGNLTFALVQRSRHGSGKDAEDARAALARIGGRAVKPLLDALADGDAGQQRVAIDVLGYVQNKNARPGALRVRDGARPRRRCARARCSPAARCATSALLPKYQSLLFPKQEGGGEAMAVRHDRGRRDVGGREARRQEGRSRCSARSRRAVRRTCARSRCSGSARSRTRRARPLLSRDGTLARRRNRGARRRGVRARRARRGHRDDDARDARRGHRCLAAPDGDPRARPHGHGEGRAARRQSRARGDGRRGLLRRCRGRSCATVVGDAAPGRGRLRSCCSRRRAPPTTRADALPAARRERRCRVDARSARAARARREGSRGGARRRSPSR